MAIRLTPNLSDTEELLGQILTHVIPDPMARVSFLVPAGQGFNVCARIRTMISRKRKKISNEGKRPKRFQLNSSVHPETHEGMRMECVVIWQRINDSHGMLETVEEMLANG